MASLKLAVIFVLRPSGTSLLICDRPSWFTAVIVSTLLAVMARTLGLEQSISETIRALPATASETDRIIAAEFLRADALHALVLIPLVIVFRTFCWSLIARLVFHLLRAPVRPADRALFGISAHAEIVDAAAGVLMTAGGVVLASPSWGLDVLVPGTFGWSLAKSLNLRTLWHGAVWGTAHAAAHGFSWRTGLGVGAVLSAVDAIITAATLVALTDALHIAPPR